MKQQQRERQSDRPSGSMTEDAMGPAAMAAAVSVGLSWYYFFVKGDRERGLFVGLWPPTILAFAGYFNQRKIRRKLERLTQPGTTIKNALDSVMGNE